MFRAFLLFLVAALCSPPQFARAQHPHKAGLPAVPVATVAPGPQIFTNVSRVAHTVEVTLTASPSRLALVPGRATDAFAYNGRVPGPTLELWEGDHVIVHFKNNLSEATTVHWHGLHIPVTSDGSPYYPVPPGGRYDYIFTVPRGSAGTYWYHPHPDHRTGYQIAKGLYGVVIIRSTNDPLPATLQEHVLVLADNRFSADGSIDLPGEETQQGTIDRENGREGDFLFVNGSVLPTLKIRSGEVQRWRIINASAARVYRLSISGQSFLHVGSDGGLFEKPIEVKEIVISASERVELLVRGSGAPGSTTTLQALPYDRYIPQTKPVDWQGTRNLLSLEYSAEKPLPYVTLPSVLRPVLPLDTSKVTVVREISLSQGMINGKVMDMDRVDIRARLGAIEIWQVENLVGMDHPFHLHGFQFQVIERNGVPEPYRSWKDTVNVPKHETVRFVVRYDDFPGKWMFHCHILDHEDHGMMGVLEIN